MERKVSLRPFMLFQCSAGEGNCDFVPVCPVSISSFAISLLFFLFFFCFLFLGTISSVNMHILL